MMLKKLIKFLKNLFKNNNNDFNLKIDENENLMIKILIILNFMINKKLLIIQKNQNFH